jgi:predicted kinase
VLEHTAGWLAHHAVGGARVEHVVLDGRTFSRRAQITDLQRAARVHGFAPVFVECTAPAAVAEARLERDREHGTHPARDRTAGLHRRLAREQEPIEVPRLVLDTHAEPVEALVRRVLDHLGIPGAPRGEDGS